MNISKFILTSISIFIITLTLSVDDFSVGIAYGLNKIRVSLKSLAYIFIGSAISTWSVMLIGKFIFTSLPQAFSNIVGSIILGAIGLRMIYHSWTGKKDNDDYVNKNSNSQKSLKNAAKFGESFSLGLALGIDDFTEALGLGVAGFPVVLTVIFLEVSELITILTGNYLALKGLSKKINGRISILPGIILILVGIYRLFF